MAPQPLAATWRLVTEPLRAPLEDWQVTDAEADLAQRRLAALDDAVFDGIVLQMARLEGGKFLRRLLTETEEEVLAPEALRRFVARVAAVGAPATARAAVRAVSGHALGRLLAAIGSIDREAARRFVRGAGGPDAVTAVAVLAALRARAADDTRAIASLARGLGALGRAAPAPIEVLRDFVRSFAARPNAWPAAFAAAAVEAIERDARDREAFGATFGALPSAPEPLDETFGQALVEAVRARR